MFVKTKVSVALLLLIAMGILLSSVSAKDTGGHVLLLTIEDAIGPATDDYIERALQTAARDQATLVVIRMDTPGGLDTAMRGIIKNIISSAVPVASWVAPSGSRAASAGTYILYASHISAMAPGTNLGAATPVAIGGMPSPDKGKPGIPGKQDEAGKTDEAGKADKADKADEAEPMEQMDTSKRKSINDAAAYIRGLAELRGRNQDWAEKAVREAVSLQASEALKLNVIDLIAADMAELLKKINGREVSVLGKKITLETEGLVVRELEPDWRSRLLSVITNPNIAYILLLVGIYGLILEFSNPGAIVPGTIGAISLLIALYALQLLPINYAGVGLILLGVALMIGEAYQPSFGILGMGGVVAFVIGSVIMMDTEAPGFGINLSVIVTFAISSAVVFILLVGMAMKSRRRPVVSGSEQLIGANGVAMDDFDDAGMVFVHSESWQARTAAPVHKDQDIRVTGLDGLTLDVEPVPENEQITDQENKP
jgi:membrane-bound serine protease (ClpP class)